MPGLCARQKIDWLNVVVWLGGGIVLPAAVYGAAIFVVLR